MPLVGLAAVTKLQGICKRSVIGSGGGTEESTERGMGMSNSEAIVRLTEIGKRIDPDGNDYIALEMAIMALWAQERQEDDGK